MKKFVKGMMVLSISVLLAGCGCNNDNTNEKPLIQNEEESVVVNVSTEYEGLYQETVKSTVRIQAGTQLGSGVVYKEEGNLAYILTNAHVLTDKDGNPYYNDIEIIFSNYAKVKGTYIYLDRNEDVAVVSVPKSENYTVAKIVNSDTDVNVGESVYSIGNPYGAYFAMTTGTLSSNRIKTSTDYISGDSDTKTYVYNSTATINKGNSGGPLFNSEGEVVAINSMQPSSSDMRNFNYSIPINYFIKVANYIVTNRTPYVKPTLNIKVKSICEYSTSELSTLGITVLKGVHVTTANDEIAKGRIITQVNGREIATLEDYEFELLKYSKNDTITLTTTDIVGSQTKTINIKVK
jgi:serine protease Do